MKQKMDISFLLHPKDRTVEAYREWIRWMSLASTGKRVGDNLNDEEWKKKCEEFWRDYDTKHPGEVP
jgi:hypothetical protein